MLPYHISIFLNPDGRFNVTQSTPDGQSTQATCLRLDYGFSLDALSAAMATLASFADSIRSPQMREVLGADGVLWDSFVSNAHRMLAGLSHYNAQTGDVIGFELCTAIDTQVLVVSVEGDDEDGKLSYGGYSPDRLTEEADGYIEILDNVLQGNVAYAPQAHIANVMRIAKERQDAEQEERRAEEERVAAEQEEARIAEEQRVAEQARVEQMEQAQARQAAQQRQALAQMDAMMAQAQEQSRIQAELAGQRAVEEAQRQRAAEQAQEAQPIQPQQPQQRCPTQAPYPAMEAELIVVPDEAIADSAPEPVHVIEAGLLYEEPVPYAEQMPAPVPFGVPAQPAPMPDMSPNMFMPYPEPAPMPMPAPAPFPQQAPLPQQQWARPVIPQEALCDDVLAFYPMNPCQGAHPSACQHPQMPIGEPMDDACFQQPPQLPQQLHQPMFPQCPGPYPEQPLPPAPCYEQPHPTMPPLPQPFGAQPYPTQCPPPLPAPYPPQHPPQWAPQPNVPW